MRLVDPLAGEVHQRAQVLAGAEGLGLEAADLAGRGGALVSGPAAHHGSHGGIDAQALGVVDILVAGQSAVDRLPEERGEAVLRVLAGRVSCRTSRPVSVSCEAVVEFSVGQEPGVAGDVGAVEFKAEAAVELRPERLGPAVTHQKLLSWQQEESENPENPGRFAQILCQAQGFIWEIRVYTPAGRTPLATISIAFAYLFTSASGLRFSFSIVVHPK